MNPSQSSSYRGSSLDKKESNWASGSDKLNKTSNLGKTSSSTYSNLGSTTTTRDFGDLDYGGKYLQTTYIGNKPELLGSEPMLVLKEQGELRSTVLEEGAKVSIKERGAVVHEKIHHIEEEDIQPIIHLERLKTEVVHITQPIKESQVMPTTIHERSLPAEIRPDVVMPQSAYTAREYFPTVEYDAAERVQVLKPAIVEEVVKKTIIEEIQPVIERDVYQPHVVKETKQIYEKVIEAPVVREEYRTVIDKGMMGKIDILRATPDLLNQFNSSGSPYYVVEQKTETTTTTPLSGTQTYSSSGLPQRR